MTWTPKPKKHDWRAYLTPSEERAIQKADAAREKIRLLTEAWSEKFGRDYMLIQNRAIHRAKYDAETGPLPLRRE